MKKIKAIIFDMDGVLVDTEALWSKTEKEFFKRRGIDYKDELKKYVMGRSVKEVAKLYKNQFNLKASVDRIIKERLKIVHNLYKTELRPMLGALSLIKNLFESGYKLALASSSPMKLINIFLKKFKLNKYFSVQVSGFSLKKGKPAPDIYLVTSKKIKIEPQNCLVIEDAPSGILAAKRSGMWCIAVVDKRYTRKEDLAKADLIVETLEEINSEIINALPT